MSWTDIGASRVRPDTEPGSVKVRLGMPTRRTRIAVARAAEAGSATPGGGGDELEIHLMRVLTVLRDCRDGESAATFRVGRTRPRTARETPIAAEFAAAGAVLQLC